MKISATFSVHPLTVLGRGTVEELGEGGAEVGLAVEAYLEGDFCDIAGILAQQVSCTVEPVVADIGGGTLIGQGLEFAVHL